MREADFKIIEILDEKQNLELEQQKQEQNGNGVEK
jgi:hypothetical protein